MCQQGASNTDTKETPTVEVVECNENNCKEEPLPAPVAPETPVESKTEVKCLDTHTQETPGEVQSNDNIPLQPTMPTPQESECVPMEEDTPALEQQGSKRESPSHEATEAKKLKLVSATVSLRRITSEYSLCNIVGR